jgi:hypothetical protein
MIAEAETFDPLVNVEAECGILSSLLQENRWADALADIISPQDLPTRFWARSMRWCCARLRSVAR